MQRAPSGISGALRRVEDTREDLSGLLVGLTAVIEMPLAPGKGWGVLFWHWSVTQSEKNSLTGVCGVRAPLDRDLPRGNPGHRELDVRLVEVHPDKPKAAVAR